jgi:hypothetical protein
MDKIYSKKGKSQLDRMQSLLCMFPEERFDELPKWLQNDYHKLDKQWIVFPKKGKSRNKLCNCGSGLKKKRCCWNIQRYKRI